MYPQDPNQQAPVPQAPMPDQPTQPPESTNSTPNVPGEKHAIHNPLSVMEPGESLICEIKRHPIGMIGIYTGAGFLLIVLAVVIFGVAPSVITTVSRGEVLGIGAAIYVIFALFCLGFVAISNKVYWGNSWVVTSDSITQITQTSLFHKQSSQLSLGNLEDVTADQSGPVAHMFGFGTLKVETAGERSKFMFLYCPDPNKYAQQILGARERFEQGRDRSPDSQRLYRGQSDYAQAPAAQPAPQYQPQPAMAPQQAAPQTYGLPQYQAPPTAPQTTPMPASAQPQVPQPPYQGYQFPPSDDPTGATVDTQA